MEVFEMMNEIYMRLEKNVGRVVANRWIKSSFSNKLSDLIENNQFTREELLKQLNEELEIVKSIKISNEELRLLISEERLNDFKNEMKIISVDIDLKNFKKLSKESERLGLTKRELIESIIHQYFYNK